MQQNIFAIKAHILYAQTPQEIRCTEDGYLVCEAGRVAGVFPVLPEQYRDIRLFDESGKLLIPGLSDLHLHAPQYSFRGMGMDLELLDWLNTHTFPEEAKYKDLLYAQAAYRIFIDALLHSATTRACIFATIHREATELLMGMLEASGGVKGFVGKVNMDRNSPDYLREETGESLRETRRWLAGCSGKYQNIAPILTPRFTPACSDSLLRGLGELQWESGVPVQSHLSENESEVAWVKSLCPDAAHYADSYDRFRLFGGEGCPTVMAHCVHCTAEELDLMQERGVFIAHCPQSNTNLSSGAAPVRLFLERGMHVGLGSDIAGGAHLSIFRAMADAIQCSKLRWRLLDQSLRPLNIAEAFYLGTKGGGAFFGQVGSFEPGYLFDAVLLDDGSLPHPQPLTPLERLERLIYLGDERNLAGKYIEGQRIF